MTALVNGSQVEPRKHHVNVVKNEQATGISDARPPGKRKDAFHVCRIEIITLLQSLEGSIPASRRFI